MLDRMFAGIATAIATRAGQPLTFVVACALILIWGLTGPAV